MATPDIKRFEEIEQRIIPSIQDEFSPLKKVLVVPTPENPTSFLDTIVNPMQAKSIEELRKKGVTGDVIEKPLVRTQHGKLLDVLTQEGVELIYSRVIPTKPGHTPLFTRDVGVVIHDKVVPAKLKHEYRSIEVAGLKNAVAQETLVNSNSDYLLEGGDVALLEADLALVGIGNRTDVKGLQLLKDTFKDINFIEVNPNNPEAFHLDTTLGILGKKHLVYLPGRVPEGVVKILMGRGYSLVEADEDEYITCCTNVLAIADRKVIAPAENKSTNERLRASGVEVLEVELSSMLSSGGGPHCLTLPLVRA